VENEERNNGGFPVYPFIYQSLLDRTGVSSEHLKQWMVAREVTAAGSLCSTRTLIRLSSILTPAADGVRHALGIDDSTPLFCSSDES